MSQLSELGTGTAWKSVAGPDALPEETFFFENAGSRLLGMAHRPERDLGRPAVVVCHPFAHEKAVAHRTLTQLARRACAAGHLVLRFDCRGTGDSEGEFHDSNLTTRLADIRRAIDLATEATEGRRVVLMGLRLGATLAALSGPVDERVDGLVLWEPVVDSQRYMERVLRLQSVFDNSRAGKTVTTKESLLEEMRRDGWVDVMGFGISPTCFDQLSHVDALAQAADFSGSVLVVGIGRQVRERKDLNALLAAYQNGAAARADLAQVVKKPFWSDPSDILREFTYWQDNDELFDVTAQWLNAVYGGEGRADGDGSSGTL